MYDKKKIVLYIIMILMLAMIVVGITYSVFAITKTDNNTVKGNYSNVDISLKVEKVVGSENLIPMDDSDLGNAIDKSHNCVTTIGLDACHIYKITVTNNSSVKIPVTSNIKFSLNDISNLKWQEIETIDSIGTIKSSDVTNGNTATLASTSDVVWRNNDILNTGKDNEKIYYIAIWISNLSIAQNESDKGDYEGIITFETSSGEVTSTFK